MTIPKSTLPRSAPMSMAPRLRSNAEGMFNDEVDYATLKLRRLLIHCIDVYIYCKGDASDKLQYYVDGICINIIVTV